MAYQMKLEALAVPTRRTVFEKLRDGPLPVGAIAEGLPVSRPAVSQHLKVLKDAGLVIEEKAGVRRIYRVNGAGLAELRDYFDRFWDDALDAFRRSLEKGDA